VLETGGGGLGDEICSEPVVRYACEKLYPKEDVRICTKYPEVFKHLNKPCGKNSQELGISEGTAYLYFCASPYKTLNGEHLTHPFATIAQPLFIHSLDFHSLFMIRRILPDEDKRIYLKVTEEARNKVKDLIPFDDFIAFHIGAEKNSTKGLPSDYTQEVIDSLVALGHTVIVFGKLEDAPVYKNAINLTNGLDVETIFALVEKSWLLLTNDSAPLHVAAAFDNYIILLPSIKHPERLLHVRHGHRYWKAASLYKKLMVDDINWPPHKGIEGWEWYPNIENKRDYLPDIEEIIRTVEQMKKEK